jgi:phosphate-selective porin OprO/OprP
MRFGRGQSRRHAGRLDRGGGPILIAWLWCTVAVAGVPPVEELPPPSLPDAAVEEPVLLEPFGHTVGSDTRLSATWAEGLLLRSRGDDFAFRIGGRVQVDASGFTAGSGANLPPLAGGLNPPLTGAANFRRARLRAGGRMYEVCDWATEFDFANQLTEYNAAFPTLAGEGPLPAMKDLWLQIRGLPWLGTLRIGNQKDPYGFEHAGDSRWLNFMERSFSMDAFEGPFNDGYLPGIQFFNNAYDGRVAWYVGEFKNTANPFGFADSSGGSETVGRLVVLPLFEDEGRQLLHLGVSGRTMGLASLPTEIDPVTGRPTGPMIRAARFRSRGSVRNGPPGPLNSIYADSGLLAGDWQNMLGLELAANRGPLSMQAEYFGSWLYGATTTDVDLINAGQQPPPGTPLGTVFYQGGYVEALYFLTGESRTYDLAQSRFGRPRPLSNFYRLRDGRAGGRILTSPGAWQVGVRYNYLCLSDGEVNGGVLNGVTLGLNWLLNPNARIYLNYDFTYRDFVNAFGGNGSGGVNAFGTRMAFDF